MSCAAGAQSHIYTFRGDLKKNAFGGSVSGAGDVNRDGWADLIVGAPLCYGTARVYARVFSGKDGRVLYAFRGDAAGDGFGGSVSGAGDVNRDGWPDLVVGASQSASKGRGYSRVFSGRDGRVLYTFRGDVAGDGFGGSVSGAGDVNKDGWPDLVVGASQYASKGRGYARVFSGKDGRVLYTLKGDAAGDMFGSSVSGAGDVNRDGWADLIVGAPQPSWLVFPIKPGYVRLFSGKSGGVLYSLPPYVKGITISNLFGSSVSGAGDVNNDGWPDLIVAAAKNNLIHSQAFVRVFSGKDARVLYTFLDKASICPVSFAGSVSGAGDLNKDGYADFVFGGSVCFPAVACRAVVVSGKDGKSLFTLKGDAFNDGFGDSVSDAGDVNRDGYADLIVGASDCRKSAGYARVFSGRELALSADAHLLSLSKGGTQSFTMRAGRAQARKIALFLGTMSGTRPGFRLGRVTVPLNFDSYTNLLLASPNVLVLPAFVMLDATGEGRSSFILPRGLAPTLAGTLLHHAYVVMRPQPFSFESSSNAVPVTLGK